jgi:hypothetical protein
MRVGRHPARDLLEPAPKAWKQKLHKLDAPAKRLGCLNASPPEPRAGDYRPAAHGAGGRGLPAGYQSRSAI